jgi:hypothetical protein
MLYQILSMYRKESRRFLLTRTPCYITLHLLLKLFNCLFPFGFAAKSCTHLSSIHACYMTCHLVILDLTILIIFDEDKKVWGFSPCSLRPSLNISSLFYPNVILSTLSLCFSLSDSDQVSQLYKTTGNIQVLCILIFMLFINSIQAFRTQLRRKSYKHFIVYTSFRSVLAQRNGIIKRSYYSHMR